ncbi:MAG TPA: type II toxin-antitoxin system RelE/ParE family toxin [Bradyrhizobium sp.]
MKLRYTPRAAAELNEVLAYIEDRSPPGACHVQARIQAIINLLLQHPHAGQLTSNGRLRRMVTSPYPYLIFYEVTQDHIVVHGVRHAARRPSTSE